jgi:hypothetical protein
VLGQEQVTSVQTVLENMPAEEAWRIHRLRQLKAKQTVVHSTPEWLGRYVELMVVKCLMKDARVHMHRTCCTQGLDNSAAAQKHKLEVG